MSENTRGMLVRGGKVVATVSLPPGTRDATLPPPRTPEGTTPHHMTPRPDGLSVDTSLEAYGQRRWSPTRWHPFKTKWSSVAVFDERVAGKTPAELVDAVALMDRTTLEKVVLYGLLRRRFGQESAT